MYLRVLEPKRCQVPKELEHSMDVSHAAPCMALVSIKLPQPRMTV